MNTHRPLRFAFPLLTVVALALAACDSVTERVQERFSPVAAKTRTFRGDQSMLASAVVLAFKRLDFTVNSSGDNGGLIEASGRISRSAALGDSRQLVAEVRLMDAVPGQTEVQVLLKEQVEGSSPGGSSEQPLREHGFYDTFFDTVKQVLTEEASPQAPPRAK